VSVAAHAVLQANVARLLLTVRQHAGGIPFAPQVAPPLPQGTGVTLALLELVELVVVVVVLVARLVVVAAVLAVVVRAVVLAVVASPELVEAFVAATVELLELLPAPVPVDAPAAVESLVAPVRPDEVSLLLPAAFSVKFGEAT
jgi:hypothetical protein